MPDPENTNARARDIPHHLQVVLDEAAHDRGYRIAKGEAAGWRFYQSATAPGEIALAGAGLSGPFFVSLTHGGVARDLDHSAASPPAKGHISAFVFDDRDSFYAAVQEIYRKSVSVPSGPLDEFESKTSTLGDTEAERQQKVRIGQDIFRNALIQYWNGTCPMTGIADPALLRASHIKPWASCDSDAERLDVYNGFLLSSLWDAAFDEGLISFDDQGAVMVSSLLSMAALNALQPGGVAPLPVRPQHVEMLRWHHRTIWTP
ncbi:MAG: HNH endonuclease [Rhodospirillales bacterium]